MIQTHHCPICGSDTGVPVRVHGTKWTPEQLNLLRKMRSWIEWKRLGRYFGVNGEVIRQMYNREFSNQ